MRVSYYCQHVLGIGHFHRSLEICRAIAAHHPTTLILGGPQVEVNQPDIDVLRLPGLQMDSEFNTMVPCSPALSLEVVKRARQELLFNHFKNKGPDVFITELYPLGRKAFRFELDPILSSIREQQLPHCLCYCSVRDILVEKKTGREKFEARAVKTLNHFYDGLLIHADPTVITLDETFGRLSDIRVPLYYTGFVTQNTQVTDGGGLRKELALGKEDILIVASIGGGSVGTELLFSAIDAFSHLEQRTKTHLQIFCGPYCDNSVYELLQKKTSFNISLQRFTDRFPEWLQAADLSLSMAGYNTCMNLVKAGVPALVYPYDQNREQRLRATRLGKKTAISVLDAEDLRPRVLAQQITRHLHLSRPPRPINTDGARETATRLDLWFSKHGNHG